MKKLDIDEYMQALDTSLGRYTCPNCKPNDREQGFIDGVSYCKHLVRFYAKEQGYEQISLDDYMRDCQWL